MVGNKTPRPGFRGQEALESGVEPDGRRGQDTGGASQGPTEAQSSCDSGSNTSCIPITSCHYHLLSC